MSGGQLLGGDNIHYYTGIPSCWFATLSTSSSPFKCYACCQQNHAQEIASLRDIVATLKEEVSVLKSDIKAVSLANVSTRVGSFPEDVSANYVGVVAGGVARGAGQRRVGRGGMWRGATVESPTYRKLHYAHVILFANEFRTPASRGTGPFTHYIFRHLYSCLSAR